MQGTGFGHSIVKRKTTRDEEERSFVTASRASPLYLIVRDCGHLTMLIDLSVLCTGAISALRLEEDHYQATR